MIGPAGKAKPFRTSGGQAAKPTQPLTDTQSVVLGNHLHA